MKLHHFGCAALLLAAAGCTPTQEPNSLTVTPSPSLDPVYTLSVQPMANQPSGMPAIHSMASGTYTDGEGNENWVFIGGRSNGFHRMFGPDKGFPVSKANDTLWVVSLAKNAAYGLAIPDHWAEGPQLRSTNMEYTQAGDQLFFAGGYGAPESSGDSHMTFPSGLLIDLPTLGQAIISQDTAAAHGAISSTGTDSTLMVTGGELEPLGDRYYLVFGQDYPRTYNQRSGNYTNRITELSISFSDAPKVTVGQTYTYHGQPASEYSTFHRRDLNVKHAYFGDTLGLIAYSGVFTDQDGAWFTPIKMVPQADGSLKVTEDTTFVQKANLYEAASVLMYDSTTQVMYTSILGGISNYYYDDATGKLAASDTLPLAGQLPFARLINTIIMTPDGTMSEYIQPEVRLPYYLGANASFMPLAKYLHEGEILDWTKVSDAAGEGRTAVLIGYMVGGILSGGPQSGNGNPTQANPVLYEVYATPSETL